MFTPHINRVLYVTTVAVDICNHKELLLISFFLIVHIFSSPNIFASPLYLFLEGYSLPDWLWYKLLLSYLPNTSVHIQCPLLLIGFALAYLLSCLIIDFIKRMKEKVIVYFWARHPKGKITTLPFSW
jgi:hypothetical protein